MTKCVHRTIMSFFWRVSQVPLRSMLVWTLVRQEKPRQKYILNQLLYYPTDRDFFAFQGFIFNSTSNLIFLFTQIRY